MKKLTVVAVLLVLLVSIPKGQTKEDEILERFLAQASIPVKEFDSVRTIISSGSAFGIRASAKVEVQVTLTDWRYLNFKILTQTGNGMLIDNINKKLQEEKETTERIAHEQMSFTRANYDIRIGKPEESGLLSLINKPLKKEVWLIDGTLLVNSDGDLVVANGFLAKNPLSSIGKVRIVKKYKKISGVNLPVSLETSGKLKGAPFLGGGKALATYHYLSVNGMTVTEAN